MKPLAQKPLARKTPRHGAGLPGEIRIIGGLWKRSKLTVPGLPGLRPTPDRVRETLFNWLGQDLTGWHCVDAFAGTGALGFEAASRGATEVLVVEQDASLFKALLKLKIRLQASDVRVEQGDGLAAIKRCAPQTQHVVFLDPPFDSPHYLACLQAAVKALTEDGLIYLEAAKAWDAETLADLGLAIHRYGKAGMVHFHLLKKVAKA